MQFLGVSFLADDTAVDSSYADTSAVFSNVKLSGALVDDLYITSDISMGANDPTPSDWDYNTVLHALFNGTLGAGNLNYSLSQVTGIKVKRREYGTINWMTIFDRSVIVEDDLTFTIDDKYCRNKVKYEYALIPYLNGIEGNLNTNAVTSEFRGMFIGDASASYGSVFRYDISDVSKNSPSSVIETMGSKYPFVIRNGNTSYYSGNVSAMFVPLTSQGDDFDFANAAPYRNEIMDFLVSGSLKFLKVEDGRAWLIAVTNSPSEASQDHHDKVYVSFSFVEQGDINDEFDMRNADLI